LRGRGTQLRQLIPSLARYVLAFYATGGRELAPGPEAVALGAASPTEPEAVRGERQHGGERTTT
jgi:hypothetical protein